MTRKDYVLIAAALLDSKPEPSAGLRDLVVQAWRDTANKVADALQRENPRFDRVVFAKASGIDA